MYSDTTGVQQSLLRALQAKTLCCTAYVLLVLYTLLYCLRFQRHRHIYPDQDIFVQSRFSLDTGRIAVLHSCELITTLCKHLRGQQPQAYLELHGYTVPSGDTSRWTREPPAFLDQPHQVLENLPTHWHWHTHECHQPCCYPCLGQWLGVGLLVLW